MFLGDHGEVARPRQAVLLRRGAAHPPDHPLAEGRSRRPKHFQPGTVDDRLIAAIDLAPTLLAIAGVPKPAKMQGEIFLGDRAEPPRQYVFGARDRCDETVFRFRTVRDARYRYIRNFTPERPFLQPNDYKESLPGLEPDPPARQGGQADAVAEGFLHGAANAGGGAVRHGCRPLVDDQPGRVGKTGASSDTQTAERGSREMDRGHKGPRARIGTSGVGPKTGRHQTGNQSSVRLSDGRNVSQEETLRRDRMKLPFRGAIFLALLGVALASPARAADSARRPNIVILLADDLGYADVGFQGCKDIPTPNLDALAKSGVRCTNGYVSGPYCSPTRAGLLTGRYQTRFGHEFNPGGEHDQGLPLTETTMADRLPSRPATSPAGSANGTSAALPSFIRRSAASTKPSASSAGHIAYFPDKARPDPARHRGRRPRRNT